MESYIKISRDIKTGECLIAVYRPWGTYFLPTIDGPTAGGIVAAVLNGDTTILETFDFMPHAGPDYTVSPGKR